MISKFVSPLNIPKKTSFNVSPPFSDIKFFALVYVVSCLKQALKPLGSNSFTSLGGRALQYVSYTTAHSL